MASFRTVARLVHRGLIAPDGALATDDLTSPQLADYASALHAWNPDVVEESDYKGKRRVELSAFLKRYAAAPELNNRVRSADLKSPVERVAAHLAVNETPTTPSTGDSVPAEGVEPSPPFRTVARLFRKGHIAPDGALTSDDITSPQLVDYARALREWNPEVVEESDYTGRSRAELLDFLRRYAAVPTLKNRVRNANPDGSLERVVSHLSGRRPAAKTQAPVVKGPTLAEIAKETKQAEATARARAARDEQLQVLDERRREALDKHREVRGKRDALRNQIQAILVLQIRRQKVEAELEAASQRVAALATDLMQHGEVEVEEEDDDTLHACDAMEGHVNALNAELQAILADEANLPTGDLDAIVAGLVSENHYLEEEQTLLQDRVTRADVAILMGGFEAAAHK